jgi:O-antigen/teichoic acid export membrane protein
MTAAPPRRSSSVWSLANTVATIAASLAGFVAAANMVGTDRLGLLALTGAALFPLRFSELGLAGAVTRYAGAYAGADPRGYVWSIIRLGWTISLAALVILLGVCAVVSPPLLRTTIPAALHGEVAALVPLLIVQTGLQLLVGPLTASLLGMQRFRRVYASGVAIALVQLAAIVPLVSAFGVAGMVLSQIGMHLAFAALFLPVLLRLPGGRDGGGSPLDCGAFLRFTVQFSANSLLTTLLEPAAKLTLGAHAPLAIMGLFEVMWRMLVQLRTLLVAPLNPLGIAMIGQWKQGREAVAGSYRIMSALALTGSAALILAAPVAHFGFALVTPRAQAPDLLVSGGVALALAVGFVTVPVHFLALAAGDVRPIMAGTLTNLVVQLGAGWALGMSFGWPGVMGAIVAAYVVSAVVQMAVTARLLRTGVMLPWRDLRAGFGALRGGGR